MSLEFSSGDLLATILVVAVLAVVGAVVFGLLGPKPLREVFRRLNRWLSRDAALFGPIDPYKPLPLAFRESLQNFWPTRKRLWETTKLSIGIVLVAVTCAFVTVVVLLAFS